MRWKLFLPLAIVLTLLGMLSSKYWAASASRRQIEALQQESGAIFTETDAAIVISFDANSHLADILVRLDEGKVNKVLAGRDLKFQRTGLEPIEPAVVRQVELLVAQAVATHQYYEASLKLEVLAREHGYNSTLVLWGDRLVAEVGNSSEDHIVQQALEVSP